MNLKEKLIAVLTAASPFLPLTARLAVAVVIGLVKEYVGDEEKVTSNQPLKAAPSNVKAFLTDMFAQLSDLVPARFKFIVNLAGSLVVKYAADYVWDKVFPPEGDQPKPVFGIKAKAKKLPAEDAEKAEAAVAREVKKALAELDAESESA